MSAYQVSSDTIDLIVSVLVEWGERSGSRYLYTWNDGPTDPELQEATEYRTGTDGAGYSMTRLSHTEADAIGRELIDANVRSLMARYTDPDNMPGAEMCDYFAETYTYRRVFSGTVTVARAIGAVKCYRYQACEFSGWRNSYAEALTQYALDILAGMIAEGWEWSRPADSPHVVSIAELAAKYKAGK